MPHVVSKCPECDGKGNVPAPDNVGRVCPKCHGSGVLSESDARGRLFDSGLSRDVRKVTDMLCEKTHTPGST